MKEDRHLRRWVLLAFRAGVDGGCARTSVDLARALDCFHSGRDADAAALFAKVAAARPTDPEPVDYLDRLSARSMSAADFVTGVPEPHPSRQRPPSASGRENP